MNWLDRMNRKLLDQVTGSSVGPGAGGSGVIDAGVDGGLAPAPAGSVT